MSGFVSPPNANHTDNHWPRVVDAHPSSSPCLSDDLFDVLNGLLLTSPPFELLPVFALMLDPEAVNAVDFLVYNLQCSVAMAHKSLPQKVNTMPHVALLNVDWKIIITQFLPHKSCVVICPVSTAKAILSSVRENFFANDEGFHTRQ